jgi:uncharacterized protein
MVIVPTKDRFMSMDALRGIAILGILMVNIQAFAFIPVAYENPLAHGPWAEADQFGWWFISTFFHTKFITIFSALFGAGMVMMLLDTDDRSDPRARRKLHRRRMFWLLLIGMIHAYVIWFGDILVPYAVMGLLIYGAVNWKPSTLIVWGLIFMALSTIMLWFAYTSLNFAPADIQQEVIAQEWQPSAEAVAAQVERYQLPLWERIAVLAFDTLGFQLVSIVYAPRLIGVMFIGMALMKMGFFTARWSIGTYAICAGLGIAIGIYVTLYSSDGKLETGFDMLAYGRWMAAGDVGGAVQGFGYASLVMLLCKLPVASAVATLFAPVGRMALSNYLLSSIMMAGIFFGPPGFSLMDTVSRADLLWIAPILWGVLIVFSWVWMGLFRFGPMEWLWRSLSYGQLQSIRKG